MINDRLSYVMLTIFVSGRNTSLRAWLKSRAPLGCREGPEQRKHCSQASLQALAVTSERRRCFSSILALRPGLVGAAPLLLPGLFNAMSERSGADGAVKDVFPLFERSPV